MLIFTPDQPWLAPLAGWSDLPFRLLCRENGAAVCCTEMISAKGVVYGGTATKELLATSAEDQPLVVQLFGEDPFFMAEAARRLLDMGFVWFDCNMGCAVPKVTHTGAGAALCRDTNQALRVAESLINVVGERKTGFKIRLGWDNSSSNGKDCHGETWQKLAPALADLGAGWITLHPRTAKQGFTGIARWSAIAELKKLVSIPVIASGDLFTAEDGLRCLAETHADTLMYARGALRDPTIFKRHKSLIQGKEYPDHDVTSLFTLIHRHAELVKFFAPSKSALLKMRTIVPRYTRGVENVKQLRLDIISCKTWDDFETVVAKFEKMLAAFSRLE